MTNKICWCVLIASFLIMPASADASDSGNANANAEWKLVPGAVVPSVFQVEFSLGSMSSSKTGEVNIDWPGIRIKGKEGAYDIDPASIQDMRLWRGNRLFELIHNWLVVDYKEHGKDKSLSIRFVDDGPNSSPPYPMLFSMYYLWKYSSLPEPERFEMAIMNTEAYESAGGADSMGGFMGSNTQQLNMLDHVGNELDTYLSQQEKNANANLLKVRLLRNKIVLSPAVFSGGKLDEGKAPEYFKAAQAILDSMLAAHARNAEAHYWKARLYGMPRPSAKGGTFDARPRDLDKAVEHSLKAIEISPKNMGYREAAATYYIEQEQWNEARDIVATLDPQHPVALLVADMQNFPLPVGSVRLEKMSRDTAEIANRHGLGYGRIRSQTLMVPMTVESLTGFYQEQWKQFRLFRDKDSADVYRQFIKFNGGKMKPVLSQGDIPDMDKPASSSGLGSLFPGMGDSSNRQGMMMVVIDGSKADTKARKSMQAPEQGAYSILQLIDVREFER